MAENNPLVRVQHPGIEGTPLVPAKALRHMSPDWKRVDDDAPAPAPGSDSAAPKTTSDTPSPAKRARKRATSTQKEK